MKSCTKFLCFIFLVVCSFSLKAQASGNYYQLSIDILNVSTDKDRIKVTLLTPPVKARLIHYVLPEYLPGVAGKVDAGRFLHQFYALDDKGFPIKAKKKGDNIIVLKLRKGASLKKVEYWVDDTWDDEKKSPRQSDKKFRYVYQAAGTNYEANKCFVLNQAFIAGYINGFSRVPYKVSILKPADLAATGGPYITSESGFRDFYDMPGYAELIDHPLMYAPLDTCGFVSDKVQLKISCFSESGKITSRLIRRIIATEVAAVTRFMERKHPMTYNMVFYFTSPALGPLNTYGNYGGLAHTNTVFYFFPETASDEELQTMIEKETAGDLFRMMKPVNCNVSCGSDDFLSPQISKAWWFNEGVKSYFSWLSEVRDSLVNIDDFMAVVSAKIRLAERAQMHPLTDTRYINEQLTVPLKREQLRARAMLTVFMLDIKMTELTGGKSGVREFVLYLNDSLNYNSDSLKSYLLRFAGKGIDDFYLKYVAGVNRLPYIEYFSRIGWAYSPSSIQSTLTFGRIGVYYDDKLDAVIVNNADVRNKFGLRNGDRLISIDDENISAMNFEDALDAIYNPKDNQKVSIRFIRDGKNEITEALPDKKEILVRHYIQQDPAAGDDALLLHSRIFYPFNY